MNDNSGLSIIRHVPNVLSASRIPAALLILIIFRPDSPGRAGVSLALFLYIAASDLIDGRLARHFGVASEFGYLLDGLGDRAVHVAAYLLLLTAGVLPIFLVWALTFREICQYGVRIVDPNWRVSLSSVDRAVTRTYALAVHCALVLELARGILALGEPPPFYSTIVQLVLCVVAVASYLRIGPQLARAWARAIDG